MRQQNQVRLLAEAFKAVIQQWLSAEEVAEVVERNKVYHKGICATHDFCDANMAMHEAFAGLMGYDPLDENDDSDGGMSWPDTLLWSAAWDLAKVEEFRPRTP